MANGKAHALAREELIRVLTAYKGVTTSPGEADGTTLIDSNLRNNPSISKDAIPEKTVLIMSGDAIQEDKGAASFDNDTGKITLQGTGFSAQIVAGTTFRILNISSIEIDVADIGTKIGTNTDPAGTTTLFAWLAKIFASGTAIAGAVSDAAPATTDFDTDLTEATNEHYRGMFLMFIDGACAGQGHTIDSYTGATKNVSFAADDAFTNAPADGDNFVILPAEGRLLQLMVGATGIFHEQPSLPINQSVGVAEEAIISLATANTRYILRKLTLKSEDPTAANTITVRLYGYVLNVSTLLRSFIITNANFTTYFNLVDLFGVNEIAADYIRITLQGSAVGPYVVEGQYSHGKNNV